MELKRRSRAASFALPSLLIVPYGIETSCTGRGQEAEARLLIVPYGIETLYQLQM